jgi:hypothetical protein
MPTKDMSDFISSTKEKFDNMKRRDTKTAQKLIDELENKGIDASDTQDLLDQYIQLASESPSEHGGAEDFADAKQTAWDDISSSFDDIDTDVEYAEGDEPDASPGAASSAGKSKSGKPKKEKDPNASASNKAEYEVYLTSGGTETIRSADDKAALYRAYRVAHDKLNGTKVVKVVNKATGQEIQAQKPASKAAPIEQVAAAAAGAGEVSPEA